MKLVRFGEPGRERPGVIDRQGNIRDVSSRVSDWAGANLDPAWLAELSASDLASFPVVAETSTAGIAGPHAGQDCLRWTQLCRPRC